MAPIELNALTTNTASLTPVTVIEILREPLLFED